MIVRLDIRQLLARRFVQVLLLPALVFGILAVLLDLEQFNFGLLQLLLRLGNLRKEVFFVLNKGCGLQFFELELLQDRRVLSIHQALVPLELRALVLDVLLFLLN